MARDSFDNGKYANLRAVADDEALKPTPEPVYSPIFHTPISRKAGMV